VEDSEMATKMWDHLFKIIELIQKSLVFSY